MFPKLFEPPNLSGVTSKDYGLFVASLQFFFWKHCCLSDNSTLISPLNYENLRICCCSWNQETSRTLQTYLLQFSTGFGVYFEWNVEWQAIQKAIRQFMALFGDIGVLKVPSQQQKYAYEAYQGSQSNRSTRIQFKSLKEFVCWRKNIDDVLTQLANVKNELDNLSSATLSYPWRSSGMRYLCWTVDCRLSMKLDSSLPKKTQLLRENHLMAAGFLQHF